MLLVFDVFVNLDDYYTKYSVQAKNVCSVDTRETAKKREESSLKLVASDKT